MPQPSGWGTETHPGAGARLGEVVETSSTSFTAQCYRLYGAPPLGALVRAGDAYAVVTHIATEGVDPGRPAVPRGEGEATEEDIYRSNPQLEKLLATRFQALVVGHAAPGGTPRHYLPGAPPRIHAFVYACANEEVARFTQRLDFLHLLVASQAPGADEAIAACLRLASACHLDGRAFLVGAGKALAGELTGQLPRLNAVLRRLA